MHWQGWGLQVQGGSGEAAGSSKEYGGQPGQREGGQSHGAGVSQQQGRTRRLPRHQHASLAPQQQASTHAAARSVPKPSIPEQATPGRVPTAVHEQAALLLQALLETLLPLWYLPATQALPLGVLQAPRPPRHLPEEHIRHSPILPWW